MWKVFAGLVINSNVSRSSSTHIKLPHVTYIGRQSLKSAWFSVEDREVVEFEEIRENNVGQHYKTFPNWSKRSLRVHYMEQ